MKKSNLNLFFLCLLALSVLMVSCGKDVEGCTDATATNYDADADTNDDSCTYERDEFLGSFAVNDVCGSESLSYDVSIAESSTATNIIVINNFGDLGAVLATVSGTGISFSDTVEGYSVSGTGELSGNTLTVIYDISGTDFSDSCTMTAIRQ